MASTYIAHIKSPVGLLALHASLRELLEIKINPADDVPETVAPNKIPPVLQQAIIELTEYFEGERKVFSVPCYQEGTAFQQQVWKALLQIPFGKAVSYLDIAKACGNAGAVRAVGGANALNKIPIIIPCHRVIGSNGKLTGYAGGLPVKSWLLRHESRYSFQQQLSIF